MSKPPIKAFEKVIEYCQHHASWDCKGCPLFSNKKRMCICVNTRIPGDWKLQERKEELK